MRLPLPLLLVSLALVGAGPGTATPATSPGGTISGRVLAVQGGKPVSGADVYVYLQEVRPRHRRTPPGAGRVEVIKQEHEQFDPHVLVVPVGTSVAFPNYDSIEHNVFSPTDPPGQFDLGRYSTDHRGKRYVFEDAAEMEIYCDIHPRMWAKVKVVDSDQIARVKDARFVFEHVPPGTYKVMAWAPNSVEVPSEKLVVTDGANVPLATELHVQLGRERPSHLRKDGQPYPPYRP